jgi:hypothetical protein
MGEWRSGELAGLGRFHCTTCEYRVSLNATDEVPVCPRCYGTQFVRSSLFADPDTAAIAPTVPVGLRVPSWLEELRRDLNLPGQYVAYRTAHGECVAFRLRKPWTRIGRSVAAQIRFDDPTVSRRHALVVRQPNGFHILDDRSLNGVFVNGQRVDWRLLADEDEIVVGRHHLHFLEVRVAARLLPELNRRPQLHAGRAALGLPRETRRQAQ